MSLAVSRRVRKHVDASELLFQLVELTVRLVHISALLTVHMQPRCNTACAHTNQSHKHGSEGHIVAHDS